MTPDQMEEKSYLSFKTQIHARPGLETNKYGNLLVTTTRARWHVVDRSGWLQQHLTKSGAETTATESFAIAAGEAFIPADQSTVVVTHAWSLELVAL
jgi:hypothetical protein